MSHTIPNLSGLDDHQMNYNWKSCFSPKKGDKKVLPLTQDSLKLLICCRAHFSVLETVKIVYVTIS